MKLRYRKHLGRQLKETQDGMMVVEAVLSFTVFIMAVMMIIYLTTIHIVHNRIQFAINSAAHELAGYSYVYQALGLREAEQAVRADGKPYTKPIDETASQVVDSINKIQGLYTDATGLSEGISNVQATPESIRGVYEQAKKTAEDAADTAESVGQSAGKIKTLMENPNDLLVGMIYMGASGASYAVKSAGASAALRGLTKKYLEEPGRDAEAYITAAGIKGGYDSLDFKGTTMFCDKEKKMIDVVVQYDIDLSFLGLVLPGDTLHMVQRVTVPGWLDGDGRSPKNYLGK